MAPDGRMFNAAARKGELFELRQSLNATDPKERRRGVKRVVAAMTLGRDVSSLFADVIKNATLDSLAVKKLVYLYVINYARKNAELVILVINTFVKDASDPNPLIRALSLRTMALIRMDGVTEYLVDPLHKALADKDPYVRKTAAVCVAKLYDADPDIVTRENFIAPLQDLLSDGNPMTVANAVAALAEIAEASNSPRLLALTAQSVPRYLSALGECTEWGQVFVLDAVAAYSPADADEARAIIERIIPRMQHANPAVVLSAVRIIFALLPKLDADPEARPFLLNKMRAPLITLLNSPPELQFVALRNINLLVRAHPALFAGHAHVFFVSYADPLYVKVEKVDILVRLASASNARALLSELREYASEIEMAFVRIAVAAIGRVALRVQPAAPEAVSALEGLLAARAVAVANPVACALQNVLRAYPRRFDSAVEALCDASESITDPDGRAALVWIVGEHADRLPASAAMVGVFLETIAEEPDAVQSQILTSAVKVYLHRGEEARGVVERAVAYATGESENPDLRDRGVVYARLLSSNVEGTRHVVLAQKPPMQDASTDINSKLLSELLRELGSVAAVYRQPVVRFRGVLERPSLDSAVLGDGGGEEDLLGLGDDGAGDGAGVDNADPAVASAPKSSGLLGIDDFLGGGAPPSASAPQIAPAPSATGGNLLDDMLGISSQRPAGSLDALGNGSRTNTSLAPQKVLLPADKGQGLLVRGGLVRRADGSLSLDFDFENQSASPMSDFAIQLRKNVFGFVPATSLVIPAPIPPKGVTPASVPLGMSGDADVDGSSLRIQIAFKFSGGNGGANPTVVYCAERLGKSLDVVLEGQQSRMNKKEYLEMWAATPDAQEVTYDLQPSPTCDLTDPLAVMRRLEGGRIFLVAKRTFQGATILYVSARVLGPLHCLIMAEITLPSASGMSGKLASRSPIGGVAAPFLNALGDTCQRLLQ